jgi:hypothetical protein
LSAETCGAGHPDQDGVACDRRPHHNIGFHRDSRKGAVWEADPLPAVEGSGRGALAAMAARTTRHHHTGHASEAVADWRDRR